MTKEISDLIYKVSEGNPGALRVITSNSFQWYTKRVDMLNYMLEEGLTGSKIRERYKDFYKEDIESFAKEINIGYNNKKMGLLDQPFTTILYRGL